jgi:hypothetical protein
MENLSMRARIAWGIVGMAIYPVIFTAIILAANAEKRHGHTDGNDSGLDKNITRMVKNAK